MEELKNLNPDIIKWLFGGGITGSIIAVGYGLIALWKYFWKERFNLASTEDKTTAAAWRTMARESWARNEKLDKKISETQLKHHEDMGRVMLALQDCNDDRSKLHKQNRDQQDQIDTLRRKQAELEAHVSRLSGAFKKDPPSDKPVTLR